MMPEKILIVDDDKELSDEVAEILQGEGYIVESAYDGDQGEALLKANKYDIILLDFKMPGLSGVEMVKSARQNCPTSRIFVVSGRPFVEKELQENGALGSITGYVAKPFDISTLLKKIKESS